MGLFRKEKPIGELDEKLERIKVEDEILTKEAEMAEKRAINAQLKKQYGTSWAKILGINKLTDLTTLRGFLKDAKKGMGKAVRMPQSPLSSALNPANFSGIWRA